MMSKIDLIRIKQHYARRATAPCCCSPKHPKAWHPIHDREIYLSALSHDQSSKKTVWDKWTIIGKYGQGVELKNETTSHRLKVPYDCIEGSCLCQIKTLYLNKTIFLCDNECGFLENTKLGSIMPTAQLHQEKKKTV